jgi:transposase
MFGDEARFGRMNRPRPCWAPIGIRPEVACQLIREYVYLYGAVSPKDGTCIFLILPAPDTCFQIFLETLAKKYYKELILLFVDGAGNHCSDELEIPANIILHLLPPYSPELNPQENIWDEIREKIFKNYALKSMSDVNTELDEAALYIERNRTLVKSIASFPYIVIRAPPSGCPAAPLFQAGQRDRTVESPPGGDDRGHHESHGVATAFGARLLRRRGAQEARTDTGVGQGRR